MKRNSINMTTEDTQLDSKVPKLGPQQETVEEGLQQGPRERDLELGHRAESHLRESWKLTSSVDGPNISMAIDMFQYRDRELTLVREKDGKRERDLVSLRIKLAAEEECSRRLHTKLALEERSSKRLWGHLATEKKRVVSLEGELVRVEGELATQKKRLIRVRNELAAEKENSQVSADIIACLRTQVQDSESKLYEAEVRIEDQTGKTLCAICFEQPRNALCLPCRHLSYCISCLDKHLSIRKTCPTCRHSTSGFLQCYGLG